MNCFDTCSSFSFDNELLKVRNMQARSDFTSLAASILISVCSEICSCSETSWDVSFDVWSVFTSCSSSNKEPFVSFNSLRKTKQCMNIGYIYEFMSFHIGYHLIRYPNSLMKNLSVNTCQLRVTNNSPTSESSPLLI